MALGCEARHRRLELMRQRLSGPQISGSARETGKKAMSTFVKNFVERATNSRRNVPLVRAAGLTSGAMPGHFARPAHAASVDPFSARSYHDHATPAGFPSSRAARRWWKRSVATRETRSTSATQALRGRA
jgi:hypothetical protein